MGKIYLQSLNQVKILSSFELLTSKLFADNLCESIMWLPPFASVLQPTSRHYVIVYIDVNQIAEPLNLSLFQVQKLSLVQPTLLITIAKSGRVDLKGNYFHMCLMFTTLSSIMLEYLSISSLDQGSFHSIGYLCIK